MLMTSKQLRRFRDRYGILYSLVYKAEKQGRGKQAMEIFNKWLRKKITYSQALRELRKIVNTR